MKIILTEEEYMERLSSILKRDFFPDLLDEFSEPERLSITEFQSLFSTEDNASFEKLLARENERKRKKFERIYGAPPSLADDPSRRLLLHESEVDLWKFKKNTTGTLLIQNSPNIHDSLKPVINIKNTRFNNSSPLIKSKLNGFKVPATPAREQLAHSLAATSSFSTPAKISKKKQKNVSKEEPKYSLQDLKALTPRRDTK